MIGRQEAKVILAFGGDTMWSPAQRSDDRMQKDLSLKHDAKGSVVGNKQPDKFKYMAKVGEGNDTRYFYSQEELDAYKKTLSKDELAKTNIQMMNESQADMDLIDRKALQKSNDKENPTTAEKEKSESESAKAETTDEESEKKGKGGSGGGGRKGGSGKGKGKGKSKGKGKGDSDDKEEKTTKLNIGEMSDKELVQYLNKNKKLADQILSQIGLTKKDLDVSKGLDVSSLRKAFTKNDYLDKEDKDVSLYSVLDAYGHIKKPIKKNKSAKAATLAHMDEDFLGLEIYTEELYHYGRKGMKWYQHIYGPVQSIAKYAKKAGSKMADAKANHDEKAAAKWEVKKEKIIRSGNAKAVRKISDKLTDDELRRADNRINEKNRLDSMTGRQQQGQQNQNNNQQKYKEPSDLLNDFNKFANTAVNTYNNIDKIIKTVDDLQKYTPEGRAKAAEKKRIIGENDVDAFLSNLSMFNDNEKKAFNQVGIAINQVRERERAKYEASKQTPDFGPQTLTQQKNWKEYVDGMDIKYGSATPSQKRTDPLLNESNSVSLWEKALDEARRTPVSESELQQAYEHILDEQRRR